MGVFVRSDTRISSRNSAAAVRRQRAARLETLRFQLASERRSVEVLRTRAEVRSEMPSGERWEEATRKVAKLQQVVVGLEQPVSGPFA